MRHSVMVRFYAFLIVAFFLSSCQKEGQEGYDYTRLGWSARDLLSTLSYDELTVEISYMGGFVPEPAALDSLKVFLQAYLHKRQITIYQKQIPAFGRGPIQLGDIVAAEKRHRRFFTQNRTIAVHILIADAEFTSDLFGLSYWNTSFCLFGPSIVNAIAGTQLSPTIIWASLFQHEFGHLMGLVDQGSPMQQNHLDVGNGAHCTNTSCLMYHEVETSTQGTTIPQLDIACRNDLRANGGK
jgi:hypothetical protein